MKKLTLFIALFFLFAALPNAGRAQTAVSNLDHLEISLWPDYDRSSTLVLLTGTLSPETALPAEISVPLPGDAESFVVARMTSNGNMIDDISHDVSGGFLTFSSPEIRFRVEYYVPYAEEGDQRSIDFTWLAPQLNVGELEMVIQQPASAVRLTTDPRAASVTTGGDGLQYHALPLQAAPAGELYTTAVEYTMNSSILTINTLSDNTAVNAVTESAAAPAADTNETNWPLILGAIGGTLILLSLGFYLLTSRPQKRPAKPRPLRAAQRPSGDRFCRECGESISSADKFCKSCGTAVKK